MSLETAVAYAVSKVGMWWPLADEDQLFRASAAYERTATALRAAAQTGTSGARIATAAQSGPAIEAFAALWATYDGDCDAGLPCAAQAASNLAIATERFGTSVVEAKEKLRRIAQEIAAGLVVGGLLSLATIGISAVASAALTVVRLARVASMALKLHGIIASIATAALSGAVFGAVDGFLASIAVQLIRGEGIDPLTTLSGLGWGAGSGFLLGPPFAALGILLRNGWRSVSARLGPFDGVAARGAAGRGVPVRSGSEAAKGPVKPAIAVRAEALEGYPNYIGYGYQKSVLDFDEVQHLLERTAPGAVITESGVKRVARGVPPHIETDMPERTVQITIGGSRTARLIPDGGATPIAFPPGSKFLVVARDFNEQTGHHIHLQDVSTLSPGDLLMLQIETFLRP